VFAASIVVGVAAGLAGYQLIEKPAMKLFRTGLRKERPHPAAVVGAP
jgi:exopolysaccharide production protein ExoZ